MDHTFECLTATPAPAGSIRAASSGRAIYERNLALRTALERRFSLNAQGRDREYERNKAVTAVHSPQCACTGAPVGTVDSLY